MKAGKLFSAQPWSALAAWLVPWIGNKFTVWPALATLAMKALPFILLAGAAGSSILKPKKERQLAILSLAAACFLFLASVLLQSAGDFAFLIDYERGNYADRLKLLGMFCLLPASLPAFAWMLNKAREKQPLVGAALFCGFLTLTAASAYNALPRHDALVVGRGWSVGQADLEAVRSIDRDAGSQAYTVLADQSVSAAAVSELGFKRYFGDVFFYPIPTGGPLYEIFLRMTYREPTPETVMDAGKLGGSKLVYVVINDYWWNAESVNQAIADFAPEQWTFGATDQGLGKSVHVYKLDLSKPIKFKTEDSGS